MNMKIYFIAIIIIGSLALIISTISLIDEHNYRNKTLKS